MKVCLFTFFLTCDRSSDLKAVKSSCVHGSMNIFFTSSVGRFTAVRLCLNLSCWFIDLI